MRNYKLTRMDVENRLLDAYSMAKYSGESPAPAVRALKEELNSRTEKGHRRYSLYMAHWASGYDSALFKRMLTVELECVRVNDSTGVMYTTDKSGRSSLPRIPSGMHKEVATNPAWRSDMRFIETGKMFAQEENDDGTTD